jgi:hypothetical protein
MVDRVIIDPSLGLLSPCEMVPRVLILITASCVSSYQALLRGPSQAPDLLPYFSVAYHDALTHCTRCLLLCYWLIHLSLGYLRASLACTHLNQTSGAPFLVLILTNACTFFRDSSACPCSLCTADMLLVAHLSSCISHSLCLRMPAGASTLPNFIHNICPPPLFFDHTCTMLKNTWLATIFITKQLSNLLR